MNHAPIRPADLARTLYCAAVVAALIVGSLAWMLSSHAMLPG